MGQALLSSSSFPVAAFVTRKQEPLLPVTDHNSLFTSAQVLSHQRRVDTASGGRREGGFPAGMSLSGEGRLLSPRFPVAAFVSFAPACPPWKILS